MGSDVGLVADARGERRLAAARLDELAAGALPRGEVGDVALTARWAAFVCWVDDQIDRRDLGSVPGQQTSLPRSRSVAIWKSAARSQPNLLGARDRLAAVAVQPGTGCSKSFDTDVLFIGFGCNRPLTITGDPGDDSFYVDVQANATFTIPVRRGAPIVLPCVVVPLGS
ncbi:hypothetical protein ACH4XT_10295 [Streptomyces avidinii]|uniref:hypothetical protein n=1 Tax=Streptomyces avidinii TaxID=1895 RepID=UPI003797D29E